MTPETLQDTLQLNPKDLNKGVLVWINSLGPQQAYFEGYDGEHIYLKDLNGKPFVVKDYNYLFSSKEELLLDEILSDIAVNEGVIFDIQDNFNELLKTNEGIYQLQMLFDAYEINLKVTPK